MSKKTSETVQAAADADNDQGALSDANQTDPRDDAALTAAGAVEAAPPSDELLRAHQRINLLEEDIAFLRATYGWPTKDRT